MYPVSDFEVTFPEAAFSKTCRIIKKPIEVSFIAQQNVDVEPSTGCFTFPNNGTVLDDRFIIWRAEGSHLYLQEFSTRSKLADTKLCLNVSPSVIIPGTEIVFHGNIFTLTVPTQYAIQRTDVALNDSCAEFLRTRSILAMIANEDSSNVIRVQCNFKNIDGAVKASIISSLKTRYIWATILTVKNDVFIVKIPRIGVVGQLCEEINLKTTGLFGSLFRKNDEKAKIMDIALISTSDEEFIITLHKGNTLKLWLGNSMRECHELDIALDFGIGVDDISKIFIQTTDITSKKGLMVFVQTVEGKAIIGFLIIAGQSFEMLHKACVNFTPFEILDFKLIAAEDGKRSDFNLVVMSKRPHKFEKEGIYSFRQPYLIERCLINLENSYSVWPTTSVMPLSSAYEVPILRDIFFDGLTADEPGYYKKIVFSKEIFSYDVVQKAVAIICKKHLRDIPVNDYSALKDFIKGYIKSPKFKQENARGTPSIIKSSASVSGHDPSVINFWKCLLLSCEELQYSANDSIGLWYSPDSKLFGAIQFNRLTVVQTADLCIKEIFDRCREETVGSVEDTFQECSTVYLTEKKMSVENVKNLKILFKAFKSNSQLLKTQPGDLVNLVDTTPYIDSIFTSELLSSNLRHLIGARVLTLTQLYNCCIYLRSKTNDLSDMDSSPDNDLMYLANTYRILYNGLNKSVQSFYNTNIGSEVSLATSFFEFAQSKHLTMPSKFQPSEGTLNYSKYSKDVIYSTMSLMYPASLCPVFIQFFVSTDKFEYLIEFIAECHKDTPELQYTYLMSLALSHASSKKVAKAYDCILQALVGIEKNDVALNNLLNMFTEDGSTSELYTLPETLFILIQYFTRKNNLDLAVEIGRYAVSMKDRLGEVATKILVALFRVHLIKKDFASSFECIRNIDKEEEQKVCLRQFIHILLEKDNRHMFFSLQASNLFGMVLEILESRAMDSEALVSGDLYEFNCAYMCKRVKYLRAAYNMYYYASILAMNLTTFEQLEKRCRALGVVKRLLSMSPKENYLKINHDLPFIYTRSYDNSIIVSEDDVMKELLLSEARIALMEAYATNMVPPDDPAIILNDLIKYNLFDMAWSIICFFKSCPKNFFETVVYECLVAEQLPNNKPPVWIEHNKKNINNCLDMNKRHYSILRSYLDQHFAAHPCDASVVVCVSHGFLSHNKPLPEWLHVKFVDINLPEYVRCLLEYDEIELAYTTLYENVEKAIKELSLTRKQNPILPYTVIDQFLYLAKEQKKYEEHRSTMTIKVKEYFKKVGTIQKAIKLA
uniref:Mic1 domain-containing protein n=1 Tax=Rhabditophanes sp. KR3021 TaxID=114890 RepID=A0AC35U0S7_9BILA